MKAFPLKISSPQGDLFCGDVVKISVRGTEGELAIMAGHIPFVTSVKACECKIELDNGKQRLGQTDGGILTVSSDKVVLLSGSFTRKD